jgi:hypothetical protein
MCSGDKGFIKPLPFGGPRFYRPHEAGNCAARAAAAIELTQRTDAECGPSFVDIYRKDRWTLASSVTE